LKIHGPRNKIVLPQQAKMIKIYKGTRMQLLKTSAAIWFNKQCRSKGCTPSYINITANGKSQQSRKNTLTLAHPHNIHQIAATVPNS
jgi:ribosomal protein L37AE/L43A